MEEKRLNILLLPRWYPNRLDPQLGVFIQKHARAIARRCQVVVFFATADPRLQGNTFEYDMSYTDGVREFRYYYAGGNPWQSVMNYRRCWMHFQKTVKLYREDGFTPDANHAYILLRTALLARWLRFYRGTPWIFSEQWSGYATGAFERYNVFRKWLMRLSIRKAQGRTAVSSFLQTQLEVVSDCRDIQVIYNTIEQPPTSRVNTDVSGKRILVVADLVDEIKNVSGILRAMATLRGEFPDLSLRIIGSGVDEEALKQLAGELDLLDKNVFFLGRKKNEEVYQALMTCDFLVMNSRFETFSLICAEAMSCGKPVVATRCGGPQEFIDDSTGILIPPDNQESLVDALRKMIATHQNYATEHLQKTAHEKFSAETAGIEFLRVYRRAISG